MKFRYVMFALALILALCAGAWQAVEKKYQPCLYYMFSDQESPVIDLGEMVITK